MEPDAPRAPRCGDCDANATHSAFHFEAGSCHYCDDCLAAPVRDKEVTQVRRLDTRPASDDPLAAFRKFNSPPIQVTQSLAALTAKPSSRPSSRTKNSRRGQPVTHWRFARTDFKEGSAPAFPYPEIHAASRKAAIRQFRKEFGATAARFLRPIPQYGPKLYIFDEAHRFLA